MPNSLLSTESRFHLRSTGAAKIWSSEFFSNSRGPLRSMVRSFMPSGIQMLFTQGLFEPAADVRADLAAGDDVIDPKLADSLVAVAEREAVGRLGMRKEAWS